MYPEELEDLVREAIGPQWRLLNIEEHSPDYLVVWFQNSGEKMRVVFLDDGGEPTDGFHVSVLGATGERVENEITKSIELALNTALGFEKEDCDCDCEVCNYQPTLEDRVGLLEEEMNEVQSEQMDQFERLNDCDSHDAQLAERIENLNKWKDDIEKEMWGHILFNAEVTMTLSEGADALEAQSATMDQIIATQANLTNTVNRILGILERNLVVLEQMKNSEQV